MTFGYPKGEQAFRSGSINWASNDIRILLVMSNTTADTDGAAEFVSSFATLDECDAAGYARTQITGRSVSIDTVAKEVALLAAQTNLPAFGAGTRQVVGAIIYKHVGADSANPVLFYLDAPPWFPFNAVGTAVRFKWDATGIVRYPLNAA